jgi:hypothetical protein
MNQLPNGKFSPGNNANPAGRPRGRIAKFRKLLGELTGDGREIAERLMAILRDPEASNKEVIDASALALSYLLGKPETVVKGELDVTARPGPAIDARLLAERLPPELVSAVVRELDSDDPPLLLPAGDDDDDGTE